MRIALVCGHFIPEMGYLEVHLANALFREGHAVTVFTSKQIPAYIKKFIPKGIELTESDKTLPYAVKRFRTSFNIGQMVWGIGLKNALHKHGPEVVIAIGFGKVFPSPIFKGIRDYKVISLFGDNSASYYNYGTIKNSMLKISIKDPVYKAAISSSDRLVFYTPETKGILEKSFKKQLNTLAPKDSIEVSLGFDPGEFYFDDTERQYFRKKLDLSSNDQFLITATRVARNKNLEEIIMAVDKINEKGKRLYYIILGGSGDDFENEIKNQIRGLKFPDRVSILPFTTRNEIRKYFNAADFGIWPMAAISIFEAAGTGLPLLLPDEQSMSHIINPGSGYYYKKGGIYRILEMMLELKTDRVKLAESNFTKFSYQNLVTKILEGV